MAQTANVLSAPKRRNQRKLYTVATALPIGSELVSACEPKVSFTRGNIGTSSPPLLSNSRCILAKQMKDSNSARTASRIQPQLRRSKTSGSPESSSPCETRDPGGQSDQSKPGQVPENRPRHEEKPVGRPPAPRHEGRFRVPPPSIHGGGALLSSQASTGLRSWLHRSPRVDRASLRDELRGSAPPGDHPARPEQTGGARGRYAQLVPGRSDGAASCAIGGGPCCSGFRRHHPEGDGRYGGQGMIAAGISDVDLGARMWNVHCAPPGPRPGPARPTPGRDSAR